MQAYWLIDAQHTSVEVYQSPAQGYTLFSADIDGSVSSTLSLPDASFHSGHLHASLKVCKHICRPSFSTQTKKLSRRAQLFKVMAFC